MSKSSEESSASRIDPSKLKNLSAPFYRCLRWDDEHSESGLLTISTRSPSERVLQIKTPKAKQIKSFEDIVKVEKQYRGNPIEGNFILDNKEFSYRCNRDMIRIKRRLLECLQSTDIKIGDPEFVKLVESKFHAAYVKEEETRQSLLEWNEIYRSCPSFTIRNRLSEMCRDPTIKECPMLTKPVSRVKSKKAPDWKSMQFYKDICNESLLKPKYSNKCYKVLQGEFTKDSDMQHFINTSEEYINWTLGRELPKFTLKNFNNKSDSNDIKTQENKSRSDMLRWNKYQEFMSP